MREVTRYIANNGKEFESAEKCKQYEESLNHVQEAIQTLVNYCECNDCDDCQYSYENGCAFTHCNPNGWGYLIKRGF